MSKSNGPLSNDGGGKCRDRFCHRKANISWCRVESDILGEAELGSCKPSLILASTFGSRVLVWRIRGLQGGVDLLMPRFSACFCRPNRRLAHGGSALGRSGKFWGSTAFPFSFSFSIRGSTYRVEKSLTPGLAQHSTREEKTDN